MWTTLVLLAGHMLLTVGQEDTTSNYHSSTHAAHHQQKGSTVKPDISRYVQKANLKQFRHQVLVRIKESGYEEVSFCPGTILRPRWVITAATCFPAFTPTRRGASDKYRLSEVVVGVHAENEKGMDIRIKEVIVNPKYNASNSPEDNNIAMLWLVQNIPMSSTVSPAMMAKFSEPPQRREDLIVMGWIPTKHSSDKRQLYKLIMRQTLTTTCAEKRSDISKAEISENMGCMNAMADIAPTEDGSAVLHRKRLYALTTHALENTSPQIYLCLQNYIEWINEVAAMRSD